MWSLWPKNQSEVVTTEKRTTSVMSVTRSVNPVPCPLTSSSVLCTQTGASEQLWSEYMRFTPVILRAGKAYWFRVRNAPISAYGGLWPSYDVSRRYYQLDCASSIPLDSHHRGLTCGSIQDPSGLGFPKGNNLPSPVVASTALACLCCCARVH